MISDSTPSTFSCVGGTECVPKKHWRIAYKGLVPISPYTTPSAVSVTGRSRLRLRCASFGERVAIRPLCRVSGFGRGVRHGRHHVRGTTGDILEAARKLPIPPQFDDPHPGDRREKHGGAYRARGRGKPIKPASHQNGRKRQAT